MNIKTKNEYDQLIEQITELVKQYEENGIFRNEYQFYLASGKNLKFSIGPQNISHLLGINLDYLRSTGLFTNKDSYALLKEFLGNSYSVYRQIQDGHMSYNSIFSEYIDKKLRAFLTVSKYFHPSDIEFVCQYHKSKTFQLGLATDYPCDYFIAQKDKMGNIYLLGLVEDNANCFPMTSLIFECDEKQNDKLTQLLQNQTMTYVSTVSITNPTTNFHNKEHINLQTGIKLLTNLHTYTNRINTISIDTYSHHLFSLNGCIIRTDKLRNYKQLFGQLREKISLNELFDLEQLDEELKNQLDTEWIELIQTYNDQLCTSNQSVSAQTTYTNLLNDYRLLSSEVETLKQQLAQSQLEREQLSQQVQQLQAQNTMYEEFQNQIFEAVERQKKK